MNSNPTTDCLLLQASSLTEALTEGAGQIQAFCTQSPIALQLGTAAFNPEKKLLYAYLELKQRQQMNAQTLESLAGKLREFAPGLTALSLSRMQLMLDAPGRSSGDTPHFHYIVETDPEEGWLSEIAHWYDTEHLIGLAGVSGCVRARRMVNHDQGPISLACYDLVTEETLGSDPLLAVSWTDWSSNVRPHFTNTNRTMFKLI